jgi:hypothetical protein
MIRTDRFRISARPYAVDLPTLKVGDPYARHDGTPVYRCLIRAAWFRRKGGRLSALAGTLWDHQGPAPADGRAFLTALTDGRYGGAAVARWDGSNLWAPQMHRDDQEAYYALLGPMLDAFPAIPDGFDGWWTFVGPVTTHEGDTAS